MQTQSLCQEWFSQTRGDCQQYFVCSSELIHGSELAFLAALKYHTCCIKSTGQSVFHKVLKDNK